MPRKDPSKYNGFKKYLMNLKRKTIPFPCPKCETRTMVLSKDFQNHCSLYHDLDAALCCVWCEENNVSWGKGNKYLFADHMNQCWMNFLARINPPHPPPPPVVLPPAVSFPPASSTPAPIPFDLTPMCPKEDLFDHEEVVLERNHDPIWPMPLGPNLYHYEDPSLNLAVSCVQMFLQLQQSVDFYHVMVRAVAYPSFLQAMDEDAGRTRTLPFATWCDGGRWPQARHRQHRHMIVVSPKDHFTRHIFHKISVPREDRPSPHYQCIRKKPIEWPMHLVNTLGYLSKRPSRCQFTFQNKDEDDTHDTPLCHFWISTTLPKDYRLPLVLEWDGGILKLLQQEFRNFSLDHLLRLPLVYFHQRWNVKIKDLPGLRLGLVLPVDLRTSPLPTPLRLHLLNGLDLYLEREPGPAPQVYHLAGEELFPLRKYHQILLNKTRPVHQRNQHLVAENTHLRQQVTQVQLTAQRQTNSLKMKAERLKRSMNYWKRNAEQWRRENETLQKKINRMHEAENGRLKRELALSKREVKELKREMEVLRNRLP